MKTLKRAFNGIEEVLHHLNILVVTIGEREISAHCPFHKDSHPSFSINVRTENWICYQCGESGRTLESLVSKVTGQPEAPSLLREVKRRSLHQVPLEEKPVDPNIIMAKYLETMPVPTWALERRQLTQEMAEMYGLRWSKGWVIPIWSPDGALWGWQFKQLDFVSNYPKSVKKSQTLFGYRELESPHRLVLVESPLDVVRLASFGVAAVATFGAYVSKAQMVLIVEACESVLLALDNDATGQAQSEKVYPYFAHRVPTQILQYERTRAKDPGDMSDAEIERLFEL